MQAKEAFIHLELIRRWYKAFTRVGSLFKSRMMKNCLPVVHKIAKLFTKEFGEDVANILGEIVWGAPITAHIMSGVAIGTDKSNGVVDEAGGGGIPIYACWMHLLSRET